jgi:hypothetical protein
MGHRYQDSLFNFSTCQEAWDGVSCLHVEITHSRGPIYGLRVCDSGAFGAEANSTSRGDARIEFDSGVADLRRCSRAVCLAAAKAESQLGLLCCHSFSLGPIPIHLFNREGLSSIHN